MISLFFYFLIQIFIKVQRTMRLEFRLPGLTCDLHMSSLFHLSPASPRPHIALKQTLDIIADAFGGFFFVVVVLVVAK